VAGLACLLGLVACAAVASFEALMMYAGWRETAPGSPLRPAAEPASG
jgi:hypothetical protein